MIRVLEIRFNLLKNWLQMVIPKIRYIFSVEVAV